MIRQIPVVILCGGDGLRFAGGDFPDTKVLAPIGGVPIVRHIMNCYVRYGFEQFILCVKDSDTQIQNYVEAVGVELDITVVPTGDRAPTGGRISRARHLIGSEVFMVTYGDGLANVNMNLLMDAHLNSGKEATLTAVRPFSPYGVLELGSADAVVGFEEKPLMDTWVNGGYFVFNRSVFGLISDDSMLETEVIPRLVSIGQLHAYRHTGFWKSMDTPKEHRSLEELWASGSAPWLSGQMM